MKKKSIVTVHMIVVMATAVRLVLLCNEADQNARKTAISIRLGKKFLGPRLVDTGSVGSSETRARTIY